jgi:hypothetical protein
MELTEAAVAAQKPDRKIQLLLLLPLCIQVEVGLDPTNLSRGKWTNLFFANIPFPSAVKEKKKSITTTADRRLERKREKRTTRKRSHIFCLR